MTRDDIIRWARSAIRLSADDASLMGFDQEATILDRYEFLCWFASNVATDVRADEREQCAKLAESLWQQYQNTKDAHERMSPKPFMPGRFGFDQSTTQQSRRIADAIRARSNVQQEPQK